MDEVKYQTRSLAEAVYRYSVLIPERNAIVDKQGPHTYAQLWEEIAQCAEVLKELGVKKGDRVVMECSQDALFLSVNLSCQLLEAMLVKNRDRRVSTWSDVYQMCTEVEAGLRFKPREDAATEPSSILIAS